MLLARVDVPDASVVLLVRVVVPDVSVVLLGRVDVSDASVVLLTCWCRPRMRRPSVV